MIKYISARPGYGMKNLVPSLFVKVTEISFSLSVECRLRRLLWHWSCGRSSAMRASGVAARVREGTPRRKEGETAAAPCTQSSVEGTSTGGSITTAALPNCARCGRQRSRRFAAGRRRFAAGRRAVRTFARGSFGYASWPTRAQVQAHVCLGLDSISQFTAWPLSSRYLASN